MELAAADDQDSYVAAIDPTRYASMNLVWGNAHRVSIAYARQDTGELAIERLAPGIHILANDRIGSPGFPRVARLGDAVVSALPQGWPAMAPPIERAMGDHTRVPLDQVPPSHLPIELARELTATCIHSEQYGTRSATLLALASGQVIDYRHADGPPCTTPFTDRRAVLEAA